MFDWIFGSKKPEDKKEEELGKDEQWIYDYVRQYLNSPLWRNPLLDFLEEHCHVFEDKEENKFEYTKIFQEFTGLTALLMETMIEEVGISEKTLEKCFLKGMRSEKDAKVFRQILICDSFESFKKNMLSKNKELEIQSMRKLQQQSKQQSKADKKQMAIDLKELERLELERAIAESKAIAEKTTEEKEIEEAIRQSQVEFEKEEAKRASEIKKVEEKVEQKQSVRKTLLGPLPPLTTVRPPRTIQQYQEEEGKIKVEIQEMKKQEEIRKVKEKDESQNEQIRKKRLLEQRELIRKKKQEERKEELATFVQTKPAETKLSEEELERRRNLMKRLKEQLKD